MKSFVLEKPLQTSLKKNNMQQKFLAAESGTPNATVSDHVLGRQPVNVQKVKEYADVLHDSEFSLEMARIVFGAISTMTGDKYQRNPLALDILQQKESNERKAKKANALEVLTLNDGTLKADDMNVIIDYSLEYLDEIMIETTILALLLEKCNTTVEEAVNQRMSYWIDRGYMRKE